jgi:hypothetical protein
MILIKKIFYEIQLRLHIWFYNQPAQWISNVWSALISLGFLYVLGYVSLINHQGIYLLPSIIMPSAFYSILGVIAALYSLFFFLGNRFDPQIKNKPLRQKFLNKFLKLYPSQIKYLANPTLDNFKATTFDKKSFLFAINNPCPEMCLISVKNDLMSLKYIENQTEEMCWIAIKKNPDALRHVINQSIDMGIYALEHNYWVFGLIKGVDNPNHQKTLFHLKNKKNLKLKLNDAFGSDET